MNDEEFIKYPEAANVDKSQLSEEALTAMWKSYEETKDSGMSGLQIFLFFFLLPLSFCICAAGVGLLVYVVKFNGKFDFLKKKDQNEQQTDTQGSAN